MPLRYECNARQTCGDLNGTFEAPGLKRPTAGAERLDRPARNAGVTVSARGGARLVGIVRRVTDFAYCASIFEVAFRRHTRAGASGARCGADGASTSARRFRSCSSRT